MPRKKQTAMITPVQTLEIFIPSRLLRMPIIASKGFVRLLDDSRISGKYVIFHGKMNASKVTTSYQKALREFDRITN